MVIKNILLIGLAVLMNSPFKPTGECNVWVLINYGFGHAALEGVWITQAGAVDERRFLLLVSHISPYQWPTCKSYSLSGVSRL